jgi:WD40 repeat protein
VGEFPSEAPVHSLAFAPSGQQLAAGTGYDLLLLDLVPVLRRRARLLPHHNRVASVGYSADGKYLAACTYQKTVHRWDVATLAEKQAGGFPRELVSVTVSTDGGRIAFAAREGNLYLWQPDQGQPPAHLEEPRTPITTIAFLPGRNTRLIAGDWGGPLRHRNLEGGNSRRLVTGVSKVVQALSFTPDGRLLVAGCSEGSVRLWDLVSAEGMPN